MKRIQTIPFSPEMMENLIDGQAALDGKAVVPDSYWQTKEGWVHEGDMLQRLEEAMGTLTERQAEVIRMTYWEGLDQSQISKVLGIGQPRVFLHLERARKKISYFLVKGCGK